MIIVIELLGICGSNLGEFELIKSHTSFDMLMFTEGQKYNSMPEVFISIIYYI